MSVSFYINPGEVTGYAVKCPCGEGYVPMDSYADADSYLIMWHMENFIVPGCSGDDFLCVTEIPQIKIFSENDDVDEVNMSMFNVKDILHEIGLDEECGEISPDDLLSRSLIQLAIGGVSPAVNSVVDGISVYCGREEGYVQDKIASIAGIAQIAKDRNTTVAWG